MTPCGQARERKSERDKRNIVSFDAAFAKLLGILLFYFKKAQLSQTNRPTHADVVLSKAALW